ncbi:hypothetical protein COCHEDRAFT_1048068, partial [Bipolaris maydis C5]
MESKINIEDYLKQRERLVQKDNKSVWDRDARPKPGLESEQDKVEQRAATIICAIREYERKVTFGNLGSEALPDDKNLDMGGQYLTNKERIDTQSKLFEISKMVPKGALLHLDFNAELHPEILLFQAREVENMYVRSTQRIEDESQLDTTELIFNVLDSTTVKHKVNIFSEDYPLNTTHSDMKDKEFQKKIWMRWGNFLKKFEKRFPEKYKDQAPETSRKGGPHRFGSSSLKTLYPAEKWLMSKMLRSQEEFYRPDQTVNGTWASFNQAIRVPKALVKSAYKSYISNAIDQMIDEKVMYAELRLMLLDKFISDDSGKPEDCLDFAAQMKLIKKAIDWKKKDLEKKKEEEKFPFGLKIIYCAPRSIGIDAMERKLQECMLLKKDFPYLICGFDLVGAEDRPNSIAFYKDQLIAFQEKCEKENVEIPFMFHAGETLLDTGGSDDPKNSNLYDAVLLKSKRVGHAFALMKHPYLVKKFRKNKTNPGICIELCPISNELLHLCRNVKEHPYPELLAAGIPCTVNTDNPNLFSNSMSHEFYQVMVGAPSMSLYGWKQLARWSIDYSCLNPDEQAKAHKYLDKAWAEFCGTVVDKYEYLMDKDKIDPVEAEKAYPPRNRKHYEVIKISNSL